jgi:hypothetical protein
MAERSWFFASNGQQQGPYGEAQFRDFVARGSITPDTLVWTEGMSGWQRAADVPGLMTGARPPAMPQSGPPPVMAGGGHGGGGAALSIDFGIWDFTWRSILLLLGVIVVIPGPWAICWYMNWLMSCVYVPGRPNLSFTGKPGTIALWYFGAIIVAIILAVLASQTDVQAFNHVFDIIQLVLDWLLLRYIIANIASNGQPLGLSFSGSFWAFLGWNILVVISFITIIGWAWVFTAEIRWLCRNIQGTRRAVVFNGTGLQMLWRALVAMIASAFIIPIPWVYRWMMRWQLSQTELVARA